MPFRKQVKLSRLKPITTPEARVCLNILPDQHELSPSAWCKWLQLWLGVAVYDLPSDEALINCHACGKVIDPDGRYSHDKFCSGFVRTARHNKVSHVTREEAFASSGIPFRREKLGLFPPHKCPGDFYVMSNADCTDERFSAAAFDITVHDAMPDECNSSALLIRSFKILGASPLDAEKSKVTD